MGRATRMDPSRCQALTPTTLTATATASRVSTSAGVGNRFDDNLRPRTEKDARLQMRHSKNRRTLSSPTCAHEAVPDVGYPRL